MLRKDTPLRPLNKGNSHTYDSLQDLDLVEKHSLGLVGHVLLAENFDGALRPRLPVDAQAHLTESTYNYR